MKARVLRSIHAIDAAVWDSLCPDVVFSHGWLRALEDSQAVDAQPRHIVLEENNQLVGALACFVQRGDPYYTLADRLFGAAGSNKALNRLTLPALLAYSPLAHRTELFLAPSIARSAAVRVVAKAMAGICRDERIPVSGWLFDTGNPWLRACGYRSVYLGPTAQWPNHYASFESYLGRLRSVSRHRYRIVCNELNRFEQSGVQLTEEPLHALDDDTLARLHGAHAARYRNGNGRPLPAGFFASLKQALGGRAVVHVARRDQELIGYSIVLKGKDRWHMFLSGEQDAADAHSDKLHFQLNYYFPMRLAIESGAHTLDYGMAAHQAKVERGCRLEPVQAWLRFHSLVSRVAMSAALPLADARYRWKHRAFREAQSRSSERPVRGPWWQRAFNRLAERHLFVLTSIDTRLPIHIPSLPPRLSIRPLADEEQLRLSSTVTPSRWRLLMRFRKAGYACYGAWISGELVGYLWVTSGNAHAGEYLGTLPLRSDEAFIGYTYVWPAFRGLGIPQAMKDHASRELLAQGVHTLYSGIVSTNKASLKNNGRLGALPLTFVRYRRIGPWVNRRSQDWDAEHPIAKLFVSERQRTGYLPHRAVAVGDPDMWQRGRRGAETTWKPSDPLWKQVSSAWRAYGLRWVFKRSVEKLLTLVGETNTIIEWVVPLERMPLIPLPRVPVQPRVRQLLSEELGQLQPVASPALYRLFERYVADDFTCFVAELDGQILGYNWYTDRSYRSDFSHILFKLNAQERFLVYSHTLRAWRGRGVDVALKAVVFRQYQEAGVRAIRTAIDDMNRSSMRMMSRWHAVPVRLYHYRRFLRWRRVRTENVAGKPGLIEELIGRLPQPHVALKAASQKDLSHAPV